MRILVVGAGVIGQTYAGRLAAAGHQVTILARGFVRERLELSGIRLATTDELTTHPVTVVGSAPAGQHYDAMILAVRLDQLPRAAEDLRHVAAGQVITFGNLPAVPGFLADAFGTDRLLFAFPGVGGYRDDDGTVHYRVVPQQPTTIGAADGAERAFATALTEAGFATTVEDDMPAWLTTHAVFITGAGAAILARGGDSIRLAQDRRATAGMVAAIGQALRALERAGTRPAPAPLRMIFAVLPTAIGTAYWRRQLRGPVGTQTIAPHIVATRHSELPALVGSVRETLGSSAPRFDALLEQAGL